MNLKLKIQPRLTLLLSALISVQICLAAMHIYQQATGPLISTLVGLALCAWCAVSVRM